MISFERNVETLTDSVRKCQLRWSDTTQLRPQARWLRSRPSARIASLNDVNVTRVRTKSEQGRCTRNGRVTDFLLQVQSAVV